MKKVSKFNKRAFTLVEMMLVVAIILILATVLATGLQNYIDESKANASAVNEHNDVNDAVQSDIKSLVHG